MDKPEFVYVVYIASTPEKVWEALTGGDFTYQYWGGRRIESSWQVGAPVRHIQESGQLDWDGVILAADPPKLLSYTFDVPAGGEKRDMNGNVIVEEPEPPSRVTFEISPFMGQVRLMITHDQFLPGSKRFEGIRHGWPAILSSLKSLLETGRAMFPEFR